MGEMSSLWESSIHGTLRNAMALVLSLFLGFGRLEDGNFLYRDFRVEARACRFARLGPRAQKSLDIYLTCF